MPLIECELAQLVMSETQDRHVVTLKETDGDRTIQIWIGLWEVYAIHRTVNEERPVRPMTHELFGNVLDELGVEIERIIISELRGKTFFGRLILKQDGQTFDIDSRPSDAIALAVQKGAPIFVEEAVLEEASKHL